VNTLYSDTVMIQGVYRPDIFKSNAYRSQTQNTHKIAGDVLKELKG